jgi:Tfp pilus assembly protein PilF
MRERYELAEKHYKKAIKLKPDFTDAKNNLGRVYVEIGQFKQAEALLNEVILDLTYIDFPKAYANLGILEFRRKKYTEAISFLKKSLERDRENCFTHVYLGRSYLEIKETTLAVSQLEKALPFCQLIESDEALYYSAIALYRNNQKAKAKFRFEDLIKTYPAGYNNEKAQKMLQLIKKGT